VTLPRIDQRLIDGMRAGVVEAAEPMDGTKTPAIETSSRRAG
jgi:hypothetical protein